MKSHNIQEIQERRTDEKALAEFTGEMLEKLEKHRKLGRSGWYNESVITSLQLARQLLSSVFSGDWVSVANYAMMLHKRKVPADICKEATLNPETPTQKELQL